MVDSETFRAEVSYLLTGMTFVAGNGRFLGGRRAAVEFLPVTSGSTALGFRIVPAGVRPGVSESTLEEGRRRLERDLAAAGSESDKQVIQGMLTQLSYPRAAPGDLAGWRLLLLATLGDVSCCVEATTDERGCALFHGVDPGSVCEVRFAQWRKDGWPSYVTWPSYASVNMAIIDFVERVAGAENYSGSVYLDGYHPSICHVMVIAVWTDDTACPRYESGIAASVDALSEVETCLTGAGLSVIRSWGEWSLLCKKWRS